MIFVKQPLASSRASSESAEAQRALCRGLWNTAGQALLLLVMGAPYASLAQGTAATSPNRLEPKALEEVLVTAELRATPWLEQSSSSSILDGNDIQRRAATHLENLLLLAPNVNIAGGTSRARFYQIRGIGERSQFVEPLNPSVGLLIDGIDFSGLGGAATLFDTEQVEVLRGPQGTLHGANALAGLINVRSAAPQEEFALAIQTALGDFGRRDLGASVTGALGSKDLLFRAAAFQHQSDGFIDNTFLRRDNTNEREETLLRGKLRWAPADQQQLDLTVMHIDVDNGYDAFSLDNTRSTLSDMPGRDRQESDAIGVHYDREGQNLRSEFMLSAAQTDTEYSYDEDWSFVGIAPELEYSSFDQYLRERRSYSAQLRLSSARPINHAGRDLDWVTGIYALQDEENLLRRYTFLETDFRSQMDVKTLAAYAQVDLEINSEWSLSGGLRLAERHMRYRDSEAITGDPENTLWGGKLAVTYTSDTLGMFYASLSRGYRAGGVNASIIALPDADRDLRGELPSLQFFDEELLYNLEIGHKQQFFDRRLVSALTLFYMDRRDQQVRGSLVIPRDDGSSAFVDFTDNAAAGRNLGLEWQVQAVFNAQWQSYLNLGLLKTRFEDYINADGRDLNGRDQAHAPGYQFSAGISYLPAPHWKANLEWEGRDAFFFSDRHDARSPRYTLLHLNLAYEQQRWDVGLFARNLLDEDYFVRGFGSFGNDPRKGYVTEEYRQFGEPRTIGIRAAWRL